MRLIIKKKTPSVLIEKQKEAISKKLNSAEAYALLNHSEKQEVLKHLMEEQGYLCAYCMRKIPDERALSLDIHPVTIEHWLPRRPNDHTEQGQGLDYNNLFAVCSGNRGKRHTRKKKDLTCDAKRSSSDKQLTLKPTDEKTLKQIKYKENGVMYSDNTDIQDDIERKLNLNCISDAVQLPETRKKVLEELQQCIPDEREDAIQFCKEVLKNYENETDRRTPYSGILIWWLRDFLQV